MKPEDSVTAPSGIAQPETMGRVIFDTATTPLTADRRSAEDSLGVAVRRRPGRIAGGSPDPGAAVPVEGSTTYQRLLDHDPPDHPEKWREFHGDKPTFVHRERCRRLREPTGPLLSQETSPNRSRRFARPPAARHLRLGGGTCRIPRCRRWTRSAVVGGAGRPRGRARRQERLRIG